jgi:DNA ligase (NAD+)
MKFIVNFILNKKKMSRFTSFVDFSKLSQDEQLKLLLYYQDQYENNGLEQIDDATFDTLVSIYERNSGLKYREVGFLPSGEKVTLPYYLGSLDKTKGTEAKNELNRWKKNYTGPWVIEDKIDGISGLYVVKHILVKGNKAPVCHLYTRGNGTIGTDVSHLLQYLQLPVPEFDIAIRGEMVIPLKDFNDYNSRNPTMTFKNARNAGSGIVNSKETNQELASKLKFYAYNILDWSLDKVNQEYQLGYLRGLGFETPWYTIGDILEVSRLEEYLKLRRGPGDYMAPYDIDGLVIVNNKVYEFESGRNPRHMLAFKVDVFTETTVIDVVWEASKDGILKPVVIYEPINTGGVTMTRASGKNAKFIVNNSIGPGAKIVVTRAGDVIPDIVECLSPALIMKLPTENYKWNDSEIEFVLTNIENNEDVQKGRIEYFMKTMDIKNVGPGRINLLYEYGFKTLYDILNSHPKDLEHIPGLGEKSAIQIYESIHSIIDDAPLANLMAASGVFGPGFGTKRMEAVLEIYPDILSMSSLSKAELTSLISNINGFDKNAEVFADHLKEFVDWLHLHSMIKIGTIKAISPKSSRLQNLKIVFTGFRNSDLENKIKENGGSVVSAISKSTSILVAKNLSDLKTKGAKAQELGVPIMTLDQFLKEYSL